MDQRERILDAYPADNFLFADGFDAALVGVEESGMRLIYSVRKCLAIIREQMGPALPGEDEEDYDHAREHFDFNVSGSYMGAQTPIWCEDEYLD